jgi:hypothetical protein
MKHKMYDILTEAVKGEENINKMKQMISDFAGYRKETDIYKLRTSLDTNKSSGTMDNEPFQEGPTFLMGIDLYQPDLNLVNRVLKELGQDIQSKGYGDMECTFSIHEIIVNVDGIVVDAMSVLPIGIKNDLKHEHPTLQEVLLNDNIFEIENRVLPKVDDELKQWMEKVKKRGIVGYQALQKGTIDGVSYTLTPPRGKTEVVPEIHISLNKIIPGIKLTPKMIYPIVRARITSISDREQLYPLLDKITEKYYKITGGKIEISTGLS